MSELLSALFGEDSSYSNLSTADKRYLLKILEEESRRRGLDSTPQQVREIVPIEEWVDSDYYLGPDVRGVYPYWKDLLIDIFRKDRDSSNNITQVILSGSLGTGKSTVAEIIMMRKLYELSCWKNINSMFGLLSKTAITFLYFSVSKIQAERTGFGEIRAWIDSIPYFKENFLRNSRLKEMLVFPENLTFVYGSGSQHSIGMSVIGTILDEANFRGTSDAARGGAGDVDNVSSLYSGILNRAASRFLVEGGFNHSLNILISSSTFESSFTEKQIEKSKDDPHTIIRAPSQWDVKQGKFGKSRFYVCKGSDFLEPYIVESVDDVSSFRMAEGIGLSNLNHKSNTAFESIKKEVKALPTNMRERFIAVPTDLRQNFITNILKSLQDLAGVSVGSQGKLFTSKAVYNSCLDDSFEHPFIQDSIIISTGDDIEIKDYVRRGFRWRRPEMPRYIHIDQSTTNDRTGIASVYLDSVIEDSEGQKKAVVGVDFMLQIVPPKAPKKIALYKIRNFVLWMYKSAKLKIGKVTYDMFNSEESRQILDEQGLNVGYQSVDKTDKAYVDLVSLMFEGRYKTYEYVPFRDEIFNVIHYRERRKVDHTKDGSKDVSDAVAGAVHNLLSTSLNEVIPYQSSVNEFVRANIDRSEYYTPTVEKELIDAVLDDMIDELCGINGVYM